MNCVSSVVVSEQLQRSLLVIDGLAPCDEDEANLEEEDLACYRYTDDYQDHQLELAPSNGCKIKGGQLIDLSDFLLRKISILDIDDIDI